MPWHLGRSGQHAKHIHIISSVLVEMPRNRTFTATSLRGPAWETSRVSAVRPPPQSCPLQSQNPAGHLFCCHFLFAKLSFTPESLLPSQPQPPASSESVWRRELQAHLCDFLSIVFWKHHFCVLGFCLSSKMTARQNQESYT